VTKIITVQLKRITTHQDLSDATILNSSYSPHQEPHINSTNTDLSAHCLLWSRHIGHLGKRSRKISAIAMRDRTSQVQRISPDIPTRMLCPVCLFCGDIYQCEKLWDVGAFTHFHRSEIVKQTVLRNYLLKERILDLR